MGLVATLGRKALVAIATGLIILVGRRLPRLSLALSLAMSRVDATGRLPGLRRVHRAQLRVRLPRPRTSLVQMRLGAGARDFDGSEKDSCCDEKKAEADFEEQGLGIRG